ncbi:ribosome maturation factor RimM [Robbsia sp. KACC 23696]|uniref:ribosome maturation factor RimM n=1 Tax=Robbsia sp. KACC 23696 TaxID=3149231 RepID=UPI00325B6802
MPDFGAFRPRPAKGGVAEKSVDASPNAERDAEQSGDAVASMEVASFALPDDLIEVGVIGQAYGVRGQVKVFPHAGAPDGDAAMLNARHWWLRGPRDAAPRRLAVRGPRVHSGAIAASIAGCDDRDAAMALKGTAVLVRRADFPALPDGEYYWVDLIDLAVVNPAGTALGRVRDLMDNGAHSVLRVVYDAQDADGLTVERERLIPFVDAYLREVDLPGKRIVVDWDVDY